MVARSRLVGVSIVFGLAAACAVRAPMTLRPSSAALESARPVAPPASATAAPPAPGTAAAVGVPMAPELLDACDALRALVASGYNAPQQLGVLVRTARTEREVRCVHAYVARFFPGMVDEWAPPSDPSALGEWWSRVGSGALYARFDAEHYVVFPGRTDPKMFPTALLRLAPLRCPGADVSCGGEAEAFFAFSEREMARLGEVTTLVALSQDARNRNVPLPTDEDLEADCERQARRLAERERYDEWASCVESLVPIATRLPNVRLKMPSQGTLVTERSSFWDPCSEMHAYSLETGLVLHRVRCASDDRNVVERYDVGSVNPNAIRSAVLFAAAIPLMDEKPAYARSFRIPRGFVDDPMHLRGRTIGRLSVSDTRELRYDVRGVLPTPFNDTLLVDHELEPKKQLLLDLLGGLAPATRNSCLPAKDRAGVAHLLDALSTPRRRLDEVLAEAGCSPRKPVARGSG